MLIVDDGSMESSAMICLECSQFVIIGVRSGLVGMSGEQKRET